jgi:adenylate kinase family enzyme
VKKVLVIGCGGAGKSTFAKRLGAATGLPVIHLDRIYWRPGWVEMPKPEFAAILDEILARDAWIMDGNYSGTLAMRMAAADTIVWLDPPRAVCLAGMIVRHVKNRGRARDDMDPGCPERLTREFVEWIWRYQTRNAPKVAALCDEARARGAEVVHLRSRAAADEYLTALHS